TVTAVSSSVKSGRAERNCNESQSCRCYIRQVEAMDYRRAGTIRIAVVIATAVSASSLLDAVRPAPAQPFTLDDEMRMRAVIDVRIAPDGARVAYVVSTPSLGKNEHEAALFVVPAKGGQPQRVGEDVHIFNPTLPRPELRWLPDSAAVSVVGLTQNGPQVFTIPLSGGKP